MALCRDKPPSHFPRIAAIALLASQADNSDQSHREAEKQNKCRPACPSGRPNFCPPAFASPQNSLNRTEKESPCSVYRGPVCPGRRAHSNGAPSNCIDSLAPLTGSSVCDVSWPPRADHSRRPSTDATTVKPGAGSKQQLLKRFQPERHVLTRPVATNHPVPRSIHIKHLFSQLSTDCARDTTLENGRRRPQNE